MGQGGVAMVARKVTTNKAVPLTVTLDEADRAELDRLSKETDRSLAYMVREAVSDYLRKMRRPSGGAS
jgi:predicted DNA-binding protein